MLGWLLLAAAAVLLLAGAELFVENAAGAARRLGLTVVAVGVLLAGAEPEELLTAVIAAARDRPGLAAGDAVGANVTMLTACLGLAAVLRPLPVGRRVRQYAVLAAIAGALAVGALVSGPVTRLEGGVLVVAYVAGVAFVWWREREPPALGELAELQEEGELAELREEGELAELREEGELAELQQEGELAELREEGELAELREEESAPPGGGPQPATRGRPARPLVLALVGIALMLGGGDLAVRGAVRVVEALGRTDSAVGLTILALATTAELFALVLAAARRSVPEIAVAGIVGSAVYNATATLGVAALVRPLTMDGILASAVVAALLPLVLVVLGRRGRLGRVAGVALVAGYGVYVVLLLR